MARNVLGDGRGGSTGESRAGAAGKIFARTESSSRFTDASTVASHAPAMAQRFGSVLSSSIVLGRVAVVQQETFRGGRRPPSGEAYSVQLKNGVRTDRYEQNTAEARFVVECVSDGRLTVRRECVEKSPDHRWNTFRSLAGRFRSAWATRAAEGVSGSESLASGVGSPRRVQAAIISTVDRLFRVLPTVAGDELGGKGTARPRLRSATSSLGSG